MRIRLGRQLHRDFDKPEVLAYVAAMLGWQEGRPVPVAPKQMTLSVDELMAELRDDHTRREIVKRLSPLVAPRNRAQRRADRRR